MAQRREFNPAVRAQALLRAKDRCQHCSSKAGLEIHHIGYLADRSLFNAMVLCARCHLGLHKARRDRRPSGVNLPAFA
jgi:5-methylcytosine-specific restriction endonuclease McrA